MTTPGVGSERARRLPRHVARGFLVGMEVSRVVLAGEREDFFLTGLNYAGLEHFAGFEIFVATCGGYCGCASGSRCTVSAENAGRHTAMYSAPPASGLL